MNCYMEKTIVGLGVILVSASLLTACNTVKGTASGVEHTVAGVGQTFTGAVSGAEQDVKMTAKAVTPAQKAAPHKAHKKVMKKTHHKTMKKMAKKPVTTTETSVPATESNAPSETSAPTAQ